VTRTNTRPQPRPVRHHSPILGPAVAVAITGALGALVDTAGVPRAVVAWLTIFGVCGAVIGATMAGIAGWPRMWIAGSVLYAGAWLFWVALWSPWHWPPAVALAGGGGAILGPLWPRAAAQIAAGRVSRSAEAITMQAGRDGAQWVRMMERAGFRRMRFVEYRETRAGFALHMQMGRGMTLAQLRNGSEAIEIAHGRIRDGAVTVERGKYARDVVIQFNTRDILAETIPFPMDLDPVPAGTPFRTGLFEDAAPVEMTTDKHMKVIGITGGGKTNLINVLLARFLQSPERIVWVIDPKGGRMIAPWLEPWFRGETDRPVIDWPATTEAEWTRLLAAAVRIYKARSAARLGTEQVAISAQVPELVIVIDEFTDIAESRINREAVKTLVRKGRSEGVKIGIAGQRGTVTMLGDGDLKSQIGTTVGLGVASEGDARQVFPDDTAASKWLAAMEHPGSMLVKMSARSRLARAKGDRIEYEQIPGIARMLTARRPAFDDLSLRAAGPDYADRWAQQRSGHLHPDADPNAAAATAVLAPSEGGQATADRLGLRPAAAAPSPDRAAFDALVEADPELAELAKVDPEAEADAGGGGGERHEGRARLLDILAEYGERGTGPAILHGRLVESGIEVTRETVQRWLSAMVDEGQVVKAAYGRYATGNQ
jgi:hypothetical protein